MATSTASKTFTVQTGLSKEPMKERNYVDFSDYLYRTKVVSTNRGRLLMVTDPTENGGRVIRPGYSNGFVGAITSAYNEHRHLILRPDDVWLAITTAFGLFINGGDNAETMRKHFVDFEGKMKLEVKEAGSLHTVNWNGLINRMSGLIEKNTKGDARAWIEPNFSTTTPVCKTVGQVVLMGVMKQYFDYKFTLCCGLPKVTLEGSLEDWKKLVQKAGHLSTFGIECLTHWSGLLEYVLEKLVASYEGNVDIDFWSHIVAREGFGSGPRYLAGWINVFMPFSEKGEYRLSDVNPQKSEWSRIDTNDVPPSTVEVPVEIDDNGQEYQTIFYGGHIVCLHDPKKNTIRPSLDWVMIDVTGTQSESGKMPNEQVREWAEKCEAGKQPQPRKFTYGA